MNPLLIASLLSAAPGLLSSLFGGGGSQEKLRKQLLQLYSPENLGRQTNLLYNQALGSPAFAQGQAGIAAGANQSAADVARNLGASGIGMSGTGAIIPALKSSLIGQGLGNLRTSAYQGAQNQAQNMIQQRAGALTGTAGPSQSQQLFGGGLEALLPLLMQYLQKSQGGGGSFAGYLNQRPGLPGASLLSALNP